MSGQRDTQPYRIGWWTHAWWPTRALLGGLITGRHLVVRVGAEAATGGRPYVGRGRFLKAIRRRLRLIRRPHRPWQAESDRADLGLMFARRAFTAAGAERKIVADVHHVVVTGLPSPYQYLRLARKLRQESRNRP